MAKLVERKKPIKRGPGPAMKASGKRKSKY